MPTDLITRGLAGRARLRITRQDIYREVTMGEQDFRDTGTDLVANLVQITGFLERIASATERIADALAAPTAPGALATLNR